MTIPVLEQKIVSVLKHRGAVKAAIFGSFARGEAKKNSDIDILVKFRNTKSLLELIRLQFELEKKIAKKVDLLTYDSVHPLLKERILREQKIIYEKRS